MASPSSLTPPQTAPCPHSSGGRYCWRSGALHRSGARPRHTDCRAGSGLRRAGTASVPAGTCGPSCVAWPRRAPRAGPHRRRGPRPHDHEPPQGGATGQGAAEVAGQTVECRGLHAGLHSLAGGFGLTRVVPGLSLSHQEATNGTAKPGTVPLSTGEQGAIPGLGNRARGRIVRVVRAMVRSADCRPHHRAAWSTVPLRRFAEPAVADDVDAQQSIPSLQRSPSLTQQRFSVLGGVRVIGLLAEQLRTTFLGLATASRDLLLATRRRLIQTQADGTRPSPAAASDRKVSRRVRVGGERAGDRVNNGLFHWGISFRHHRGVWGGVSPRVAALATDTILPDRETHAIRDFTDLRDGTRRGPGK